MSKSIPPARASRRIPLSRFARAALLSAVISSAVIGAEVQPAYAQDAANLYGMQFYVTPYLWLSGIDATIQTPLERAPSINADVSAVDVLSHLSAVPFMGSIEIRGGPLGLLGDAPHGPVVTDLRSRLQCPHEGADPRRHLPLLSLGLPPTQRPDSPVA